MRNDKGRFGSAGTIEAFCQDRLDWKQSYEDLDVCGVRNFADVMTSICVEHLGLAVTEERVRKVIEETNVYTIKINE